MPELAVVYLVGFLITAGLVALHIFLQIQKQKSTEMRFIQSNLKKINLFWSDCDANIKEFQIGAEEKDLDKSIKSILLSGVGFTFLSWLGFLFQLVVMMSLRYLAVKRLERNLFSSELSENEVSNEKTREIVQILLRP